MNRDDSYADQFVEFESTSSPELDEDFSTLYSNLENLVCASDKKSSRTVTTTSEYIPSSVESSFELAEEHFTDFNNPKSDDKLEKALSEFIKFEINPQTLSTEIKKTCTESQRHKTPTSLPRDSAIYRIASAATPLSDCESPCLDGQNVLLSSDEYESSLNRTGQDSLVGAMESLQIKSSRKTKRKHKDFENLDGNSEIAIIVTPCGISENSTSSDKFTVDEKRVLWIETSLSSKSDVENLSFSSDFAENRRAGGAFEIEEEMAKTVGSYRISETSKNSDKYREENRTTGGAFEIGEEMANSVGSYRISETSKNSDKYRKENRTTGGAFEIEEEMVNSVGSYRISETSKNSDKYRKENRTTGGAFEIGEEMAKTVASYRISETSKNSDKYRKENRTTGGAFEIGEEMVKAVASDKISETSKNSDTYRKENRTTGGAFEIGEEMAKSVGSYRISDTSKNSDKYRKENRTTGGAFEIGEEMAKSVGSYRISETSKNSDKYRKENRTTGGAFEIGEEMVKAVASDRISETSKNSDKYRKENRTTGGAFEIGEEMVKAVASDRISETSKNSDKYRKENRTTGGAFEIGEEMAKSVGSYRISETSKNSDKYSKDEENPLSMAVCLRSESGVENLSSSVDFLENRSTGRTFQTGEEINETVSSYRTPETNGEDEKNPMSRATSLRSKSNLENLLFFANIAEKQLNGRTCIIGEEDSSEIANFSDGKQSALSTETFLQSKSDIDNLLFLANIAENQSSGRNYLTVEEDNSEIAKTFPSCTISESSDFNDKSGEENLSARSTEISLLSKPEMENASSSSNNTKNRTTKKTCTIVKKDRSEIAETVPSYVIPESTNLRDKTTEDYQIARPAEPEMETAPSSSNITKNKKIEETRIIVEENNSEKAETVPSHEISNSSNFRDKRAENMQITLPTGPEIINLPSSANITKNKKIEKSRTIVEDNKSEIAETVQSQEMPNSSNFRDKKAENKQITLSTEPEMKNLPSSSNIAKNKKIEKSRTIVEEDNSEVAKNIDPSYEILDNEETVSRVLPENSNKMGRDIAEATSESFRPDGVPADEKKKKRNNPRVLTSQVRRQSLKYRRSSGQFVSMAEAMLKFQKGTPKRFRAAVKKNSSRPAQPKIVKALQRTTCPMSPNLRCKTRARPSVFPNREEREMREIEEYRRNRLKETKSPRPKKSAGKSTEKGPEKLAEKAPEKSTEKSTEKAPEKSTEKAPEKSTEKAPEKSTEKAPEKSTEKAPEKSTEKAPEKSTEKSTEKAPEKLAEKAPEKSTEKAPEKSTEKSAETSTEKSVEKPIEKSTEKTTKKSVEKLTEKAPEKSAPSTSRASNLLSADEQRRSRRRASARRKTLVKSVVSTGDGATVEDVEIFNFGVPIQKAKSSLTKQEPFSFDKGEKKVLEKRKTIHRRPATATSTVTSGSLEGAVRRPIELSFRERNELLLAKKKLIADRAREKEPAWVFRAKQAPPVKQVPVRGLSTENLEAAKATRSVKQALRKGVSTENLGAAKIANSAKQALGRGTSAENLGAARIAQSVKQVPEEGTSNEVLDPTKIAQSVKQISEERTSNENLDPTKVAPSVKQVPEIVTSNENLDPTKVASSVKQVPEKVTSNENLDPTKVAPSVKQVPEKVTSNENLDPTKVALSVKQIPGRETCTENLGLIENKQKTRGLSPADRSRELSPADRSRGLSSANRSRGLSPDNRSRGLSPANRSRGLSPAHRSRELSPAQRSRGFSSADRSRGFSSADRSRGFSSSDRSRGLTPSIADRENRNPNVSPISHGCPKLKAPLRLHTADRSKKRQEFDAAKRRKELEAEELRREYEAYQLVREKEEDKELRRTMEPQAKPMPVFRPPKIAKSAKPLTEPQSPAWSWKKSKK